MRVVFNSLPLHPAPAAGEDPGRPIRQPGRWGSAVLAGVAGMLILSVPMAASIAYSFLLPDSNTDPSFHDHIIPWMGMAVIFLLCILAHELLHALLHPGGGRSNSTILIVNWMKLQFGVYYEGRIPRGRWIAMRLLPILVLTILPQIAFMLFYPRMTYAAETLLIILILTNSLGSGGDLAAAMIVLRQVPKGGVLNFSRGKAYWLPADGDSRLPGSGR
jgi:hypothetical protein